MTGTAGEYTPKLVTEWVERLKQDTGCVSTVERLDMRRWRLTAESGRVKLTLDFVNHGNGKIKRKGSTLSVDGEQRRLAEDYEHLLQIFEDPDTGGKKTSAEPWPLPPSAPVEDAPTLVQKEFRSLVRAGVSPHLGVRDGRWVISIDVDGRALRMEYSRRGAEWGATIQLIIDGVDYSRQVRGDLAAAMAILSGGDVPAAPGQPVIGGASKGARSNSVETRRATVIRT